MTSFTEETSAAETREEERNYSNEREEAAAATKRSNSEEATDCVLEQSTQHDSAIASRESSVTLLGERDSDESSDDDASTSAITGEQAQGPNPAQANQVLDQIIQSDSACADNGEQQVDSHQGNDVADASAHADTAAGNQGLEEGRRADTSDAVEDGQPQVDTASQDETCAASTATTTDGDEEEEADALSLEEGTKNPRFEVLTRGKAEHAPLDLPLNEDMREAGVEYPTIAADADQAKMRREHAAKVRANPKLRRIAFCPAVIVVSADERIRTPLRSHVADIVAEKMDQFRFKHRVQSILRTMSRVIAQKALSSQHEPDDTGVTTRMRKRYDGMDAVLEEIHRAMTARDRREADREAIVAELVKRRVPGANHEWGTPQPTSHADEDEEDEDLDVDLDEDEDDFDMDEDDFVQDDNGDDSDATICASDFEDDDIFMFGDVRLGDGDGYGYGSDTTITPDDE